MNKRNLLSKLPRPITSTSGLIPPQATDTEKAILGAFILSSDAYLSNPVIPDIFYLEVHQKICSEIRDMSREGRQIDLVTVTQRLREKSLLEEVGGPVYITELCHGVAGVAHLDHHILILKEKYLRRELIRMAIELQTGAYDEASELEDLIASAQSVFIKMLSDETDQVKTFSEVALEISDTMAQNATEGVESTGIPTGFRKYDDFAHGMQPGDLVVIAGESSHGKTMMVTNIVNHIAKLGYPVDFHSLEMSTAQLVSRILAIESGIRAKDMLFQKLPRETVIHIEKHISRLDGLPVYFDDKSTASAQRISASIRKMVIKFGIRVAVVDYLQLVTGDPSQGREEEIGQNARVFKNLAKELGIVIIVLSQLSNSESHVPHIGRLRGSGQIKEAADIVFLVWIPEREGILTIKREDGTEVGMSGKADIINAKGRNTGTISFTVNCNMSVNRMWDEESVPFSGSSYASVYPSPDNRIEMPPNDDFSQF